MKRLPILILAAVLGAGAVSPVALANPAHDPRIRIERYDATRVYTIHAAIGRTFLIQLQDGESVDPAKSDFSALGMGMADAWTLGVRGHNFMLKPKYAFPATNLLLVTNRHTYAFDLNLARKGDIPTYILTFTWPEDERRATEARDATVSKLMADVKAAQSERDRLTAAARQQPVIHNTDYSWRGDAEALKPTAAWDDGRFTYLQYDNAAALPVFYQVLPDGTEAKINSNIDPDDHRTVVLQSVVKLLRVRLGDSVIELVNHHYTTPAFNTTGSAEHGAVRVERSGGTSHGE